MIAANSHALSAEDVALALSFDEGSGETAMDLSENGNDGILMNGAAWGAGNVGGGIELDGSDDYIEVPTAASLDFADAFSVMLWINFSSLNGEQNIIQKLHNVGAPTDVGWLITRLNTGDILFDFAGQAGRNRARGSADITQGMWHQLVGVWDGGGATLSLDTELFAGAVIPNFSPLKPATEDPVKIGARGQGGQTFFVNGMIDEVVLATTAVTADDIQSHFDGGTAGLGLTTAVEPQGKLATAWSTLKTAR